MEQPARKRIADVIAPTEKPISTPRVTTLDLDVSSANGARTYKGKFRYTVPSMGTRVDIAVVRAQYQQQFTVTGEGAAIAEALAYLSLTLDNETAPDWWKESKGGINLIDYQPLLTLYAKARAYEATFLGGVVDSTRDEEPVADGPAEAAGGDLEPHVPPAAQRRKVLATFGQGGGRAGADVPGDGHDEGGDDA